MTDISKTSVFDSIDDAKASITHLATLQKRPVVVVNSRPTSFHLKCKDSSCSFEVSCFKRKDGRVHISKFVKDHGCMSLLTGVKAPVPVSYVANRLKQSIHDDVTVLPSTIRNAAKREDGITISYMAAWRGKRKVLHSIGNASTETSDCLFSLRCTWSQQKKLPT
jgi:hypothetical protein